MSKLLLHHLKLAKRLAKLLARVRVANSSSKRSFSRTRATGTKRRTTVVKYSQRKPQSFAKLAEEVPLRHMHVAKCKPSSSCATDSTFWLSRLNHLKAWHVWSHQEG